MEDWSKRESRKTTRSSLTPYDAIKQLASYNARADLNDEHQLLLFLQSWWSRTYNRPLKDPILSTYTVEELLYEFHDRIERQKAYQESIDQQNDTIEKKKEEDALAWAEEEERKELESQGNKGTDIESKNDNQAINKEIAEDPTKHPDNIRWMEEQLKKAKELYGDSFGEDIEESFE